MAGANAYAVKLAISPTATGKEKNSNNKRKKKSFENNSKIQAPVNQRIESTVHWINQ